MLETMLPLALVHWPLFATAAVLWAFGQAAKALMPPAEAGRVWKLLRASLPWHPMIAGAFVGLCLPVLAPLVIGDARPVAALYFAASGVLAAYWHDVYQTWMKHKESP